MNDMEVVVYRVVNGRFMDVNVTRINWTLPEETYYFMPSKILYLKLDKEQLAGDD